VEKVLNAMIEVLDPTTFKVSEYIAAVQEKVGSAPIAEIKAWEVVIVYALSESTTDAQLKAAVATAMSVAETFVKIVTPNGGRRLTSLRRLSTAKEVTITANAAAQAKQFMNDTQGTTVLDALQNTLGGDVSVQAAPKAKVTVETKITSTKTSSELETELIDPTVAVKAGGTISVSQNQNTDGPSLEGSSSGSCRSGMMVVTSIALAVAAGTI
jgi:xanthine/CO dehydrogenase XdhC/CoxF family maturation factor